MKVSLFIPIFNEEEILERDLELISYMLRKLPYEYEIFVVDDASFDHSALISEKIASTNRNVTHLRFELGPTRRENLAQAFRKATGDIIAFMDIDLATNLRFVPDLISEVTNGTDIVTGSRYAKGAKIKRRFGRLVVSILYNAFIRLLFNTGIKDHECGFKAFKRDVILKLVDEMGFDKTLERGVFWDTELLVRALRHGYRIKEIPVWWTEKRKSALYFRREIKALQYIFKFFYDINLKNGFLARQMETLKNTIRNQRKVLVALAFASLFAIGLSVFRDYGISWDETGSRMNGVMATKGMMGNQEELATYKDRYYGPAFELLLYGLEIGLALEEKPRAAFHLRHLVTFLLFFIGLIFFYKLCNDRFKSWAVGLLGCAFLVLSPRIFAHAFYNSKDIAFMSFFVICIYTLLRYLDQKTISRAVVHGICCGIAIAIRMPGLILPAFTGFFLALEVLASHDKGAELKRIARTFLAYVAVMTPLIVLLWPTLWPNPPVEFWNALKHMSHYPWGGTVLYLGKYQDATKLPWHYIPVWMSVSTPVLYLASFVLGCVVCVKRFLRAPLHYSREKRFDLLMFFWFFAPLLVVIAMKSVLYDGWRQMFFIYPALILLAVTALHSLYHFLARAPLKLIGIPLIGVLIAVTACSTTGTAAWMVAHHPHQNVYFNLLVNRDMARVKETFELDYWGNSYKQGLEYIVETDPRPEINVYVRYLPGRLNAKLLSPENRERINYVDSMKQADYFIGNYRWFPWKYTEKPPVYSIKIGNTDILAVFRLNRAQP